MMTLWRKVGVDNILRKAHKKGVVLSGLSAGSICWFKCGNSDSRKFTSGSNKLIKVTGLGFINALHCPHYDAEKHRQSDLKRMMKTTSKIVSIALENCCAIEVIDNKFRIIKSKPNAKAYKIFWKGGKYFKEEIVSKKEFENLDVLLKK
jgi:dipeptidase E